MVRIDIRAKQRTDALAHVLELAPDSRRIDGVDAHLGTQHVPLAHDGQGVAKEWKENQRRDRRDMSEELHHVRFLVRVLRAPSP